MDDAQTLRAMMRDDAYRLVRVLADGAGGRTELVSLGGEGLLVRKRMPARLANAAAWAVAMEVDEPRLPRVEELYRMPDELVAVYEYVPGQTLDELVDARGALPAAEAVMLLADVCHAVEALHARGVVHRDITPANVVVASDGAHLVDLGIARQRTQGQRHDTTTLGTWGFAPPEQFGFAQTDARSDVYALGRLLGYLMTGARPGTDAFDVALDALAQTGNMMAAVVERATAFEPSARYQSASVLAQEAQAALNGMAIASGSRPGSRPDSSPGSATVPRGGSRTPDARQPQVPEGRPFGQAPLVLRVAAIAWWVVGGLFVLIMVLTALSQMSHPQPTWGVAQYAMAAVLSVWVAVLAREAYRAVCVLDPYQQDGHILRRFVSRVCMDTAIGFVILIVVVFVILAITE